MSTVSRPASRPPANPSGPRTAVTVVIVLVFTVLGFERGWPVQTLIGDLVAAWALTVQHRRPLTLQAR